MESEMIAVYVREYSALDGLQEAVRVEYRLRRTPAAPLLEVCTSPGQTVCACLLHGITEAFAGLLVRYVYENGVMPAQLRDVLQDCCGSCIR